MKISIHQDKSLREHEAAVIILAGGQGTRLFPLTAHKCKPDVSFAGRYRLIDVPISNSINSNMHNIFVISQFYASSLNKHIIDTYRPDPLHGGRLEILGPEETPLKKVWYKGTADAVRKNLPHLMNLPAEFYIILSGDQLYNMDLQSMLNFAKEKDADLTIATRAVDEKSATRLGLMEIDNQYFIKDFYEKPKDPEILQRFKTTMTNDPNKPYLGSMGIYIFKRQTLCNLVHEDPRADFGKHLIPTQIKKGGKVAAYIFDGYWEDIGTIKSYYEANLAIINDEHGLNLYNEVNPIYAQSVFLPSAVIKGTMINDSIIGDGSIIEAKEVTHSLIGLRAQVGSNSVIQDSIVISHEHYSPFNETVNPEIERYSIGRDCVIKKAIIDNHTQIDDGVKLLNEKRMRHYDSDKLYVRDGVIIVPSNTYLPKGFRF